MDLKFSQYIINNIASVNVILGKNGCGKSVLLRALAQDRRGSRHPGYLRYITPERGGQLSYDGNVDGNIGNEEWLTGVRGRNRAENFRQISVSEFRRLETLMLRKIEKDQKTRSNPEITFDTTVHLINELLDNVEIVRSEDGVFQIRGKGEEQWRKNDQLSSGESELISLAIEILSFAYVTTQPQYRDKENWLLLDEPDVHLHPDLQYRLMWLLVNETKAKPFKALIATHSTAILSALSDHGDVSVAFMSQHQKNLNFEAVGSSLRAVMPIFGAHPLSNVFNKQPILLVEGEDDERIWQQACRSSEGAIRVWPCAAGDKDRLYEYEKKARSIIEAVYENARAYSGNVTLDIPGLMI